MRKRISTILVAGLTLAALGGAAGTATARHGADDPAGHVRHGRGADDGARHHRRGDHRGRHHRGEDRRGDDRRGARRGGHDDGPNHT